MTPAAALVGAALHTGDRTRLHPTDLAIRAGAVTGIVGRNGSGKSTLLGLLAGELAPTAGRAEIDGIDVASLRHAERARRRALLTQDTQVAFGFTVEQVVAWGRAPWRGTPASASDAAVVDAAIDRQGLADLRHRPVTALSGGERKRVHLARVLAQQAPLLLLDEADSDLDLVGRRTVDEVVGAHARSGGTVVVVSHDLHRMARVCDDIVLLREGRVLAAGAGADVLTTALLTDAFGIHVDAP